MKCHRVFLFMPIVLLCHAEQGHPENVDINWKDLIAEAKNYTPACITEDKPWKCEFQNDSSIIKLKSSGWCDCNPLCMEYGGCCLDEAVKLLRNGKKPGDRYTCILLSGNDYTRGVIAVKKCDPTYVGGLIQSFCHQNQSAGIHDFVQDIPVISKKTNTVYTNYYCAVCNDDAEDLASSSYDMECSWDIPGGSQPSEILYNLEIDHFMSQATYSSEKKKWQQTSPSSPYKGISCFIQSLYYGHGKGFLDTLEKCSYPTASPVRNMIKHVSDCNEHWPIQSDFIKCQSYKLPLFYPRNGIPSFINPHCALCNFALEDNNTCHGTDLDDVHGIFFPDSPSIHQVIPLNESSFRPTASFSRIIKIPEAPWLQCSVSEIWINGKCQDFFCTLNAVKSDGKCLNLTDEVDANSTISANPCPRIIVDLNATEIIANKSLIYGSKVYDEDLYEIANETMVILCTTETIESESLEKSHLTLIVFIISEICLSLHIVLYMKSRKRKTTHKNNLLNLSVSLFLAQWIFIIGLELDNHVFCFIIAALLNALWLSSFFWMNVLSIDIFRAFHGNGLPTSSRTVFSRYFLYAWGLPVLIVTMAVILDLIPFLSFVRPHYAAQHICWITNPIGQLLFFLGPISLIILINCVLFVWTLWNIYTTEKETKFVHRNSSAKQNIERRQKQRLRFSLYAKLGLLQGVTWGLMFIAYFVDYPLLWDAFTLVTGLQGAYIFVFFDLRKAAFKRFQEEIFSLSRGLFTYMSRVTTSTRSYDVSETG